VIVVTTEVGAIEDEYKMPPVMVLSIYKLLEQLP
jgi:hypothetical protein